MGVTAAVIGAVGAVGGAYVANESRQDAKKANANAARERADSEARAAQSASSKLAMQRKAMRDNSLATGAGVAGSTGGQTKLGV